jgi:hypothetical protein
MAATPKHKRSAQKARSTRASNRYDLALTKARKMKKKGGSAFVITKSGTISKSHTVTKENPEYKGKKLL